MGVITQNRGPKPPTELSPFSTDPKLFAAAALGHPLAAHACGQPTGSHPKPASRQALQVTSLHTFKALTDTKLRAQIWALSHMLEQCNPLQQLFARGFCHFTQKNPVTKWIESGLKVRYLFSVHENLSKHPSFLPVSKTEIH